MSIQFFTQSCLYFCSNTPKYAIIPEQIKISPTKFSLFFLYSSKDFSQFLFSSDKSSINFLALSLFLRQSSCYYFSLSSSAFVASNSSINFFIYASTALSLSRASSHIFYAAFDDSLATFNCSYLGLTTFIASSYCTIALTHLARPKAAFETLIKASS